MVMTDPIADMLTRIRNANQAKHEQVIVPASKEKEEIVKILVSEGFIREFQLIGDIKKELVISLKYLNNGQRVINGLKRISKPGLRVYAKSTKLPRVLNGLGIAILSTSMGIMTDKIAKEKKVGGEVLAYVW